MALSFLEGDVKMWRETWQNDDLHYPDYDGHTMEIQCLERRLGK